MSRLGVVALTAVKPNPHRRMETYPLNRRKLDALKQSIGQVGFWEGVIVRPYDDGYECAFGHHRLAAAREELGENAEVPVIVRDLDDVQMLQFMGRENGEDYNADFLVMLETWEAAIRFVVVEEASSKSDKPLKVANFLGWSVTSGAKNELRMNDTAKTCHAASKLIQGGHLSREDLRGLAMFQAREICQATVAHLETIERSASKQARVAKTTGEPAPTAKQVESVQREYASSARAVASDLREGRLGTGKARGEIWSRADIKVREKKLPDFGIAMKQLRRRAEGYFDDDFATKVKELCAVAEHVQDEDERAEYGYLARDIRDAMDRGARCADRLDKAANPASVTKLKAVE